MLSLQHHALKAVCHFIDPYSRYSPRIIPLVSYPCLRTNSITAKFSSNFISCSKAVESSNLHCFPRLFILCVVRHNLPTVIHNFPVANVSIGEFSLLFNRHFGHLLPLIDSMEGLRGIKHFYTNFLHCEKRKINFASFPS